MLWGIAHQARKERRLFDAREQRKPKSGEDLWHIVRQAFQGKILTADFASPPSRPGSSTGAEGHMHRAGVPSARDGAEAKGIPQVRRAASLQETPRSGFGARRIPGAPGGVREIKHGALPRSQTWSPGDFPWQTAQRTGDVEPAHKHSKSTERAGSSAEPASGGPREEPG